MPNKQLFLFLIHKSVVVFSSSYSSLISSSSVLQSWDIEPVVRLLSSFKSCLPISLSLSLHLQTRVNRQNTRILSSYFAGAGWVGVCLVVDTVELSTYISCHNTTTLKATHTQTLNHPQDQTIRRTRSVIFYSGSRPCLAGWLSRRRRRLQRCAYIIHTEIEHHFAAAAVEQQHPASLKVSPFYRRRQLYRPRTSLQISCSTRYDDEENDAPQCLEFHVLLLTD